MAYTNIDDPSAYFQTKLWTGNASSNEITFDGNSDLQADWIWHKEPNDTNGWHQTDTSIGIANYLASESSAAEYGVGSAYVSAIGSNSITYGSGDSSFNSNSVAQATWAWKANGGTTASNTDGSITSTVQANTDAGFSIVTYTTAGSTATIGHGLGAKPDVILLKKRNGAISWYVRHISTGTSYLNLNLTSAAAANPTATWTTTEPTTSVYSIGTSSDFNVNGGEYVAYCFASKQGYSKFGKYTGAGSGSPFVYTGFKPALVICKRTDAANDWGIVDNKRGYNGGTETLFADLTNAESSTYTLDLLSNGFRPASNHSIFNQSSGSYIYMAFAENPFTTSTGIPTTAR
jgi:hypothetical protein